jgi:hypothetical protein
MMKTFSPLGVAIFTGDIARTHFAEFVKTPEQMRAENAAAFDRIRTFIAIMKGGTACR